MSCDFPSSSGTSLLPPGNQANGNHCLLFVLSSQELYSTTAGGFTDYDSGPQCHTVHV